MNQFSTSSQQAHQAVDHKPRRATVEWIKQFARTYTCEQALPQGLQSICVN